MTEPFVSRSQGQAFLVGPTLFLRPVEPEDAATAPVWHPDPWPVPVEVLTERLKDEIGDDPDAEADDQRLLICRRSDDRPLGSVRCTFERGWGCHLRFSHDPNRTQDQWAAVEAEVMAFLLPWMIEVRNVVAVTTEHAGDHPLVAATALRLGMRRHVRLREAYRIAGQRFDRIGYELLDPRWVATLGLPRGMEEGLERRDVRSPAPLEWPRSGAIAANAVIAGVRLSLRPFEPADGTQAARWLLEDSEVFYPNGPDIYNPWAYGRRFVAIAEASPVRWVRFGIVRDADDHLIGAIGLTHLDLLHRTAETEMELYRPEFRNRGYGTEAKHLLLTYAFERLGLHMVYSWVSEFNERSAAALRKQGYREAGYVAWNHPSRGRFVGGWYFDLLAREWRAARR